MQKKKRGRPFGSEAAITREIVGAKRKKAKAILMAARKRLNLKGQP